MSLPTALVFTTAAQVIYDGRCSNIVTAQLVNSSGIPTPSPSPVSVSWSSGLIPGSFFSDSNCTSMVSVTTIPPGFTTTSLWFRASAAGSSSLVASSTPLTAASQPIIVRPRPALLRLTTTVVGPFTAGSCVPYTITANTTGGVPATLLSPEPVALSAPAGVTFHSDPGCAMPVLGATLPQGGSSTIVYVRVTVAGPATITAVASFGSDMVTITGVPAVRRSACTLSGTSATCPIPAPTPDPTRSLLVYQVRGHNPLDDEPQAHQTRCVLSGANVVCNRNRPGVVMNITFQILELASGLSVLRGNGAGCPNMPITLPAAVDPNLSVSFSAVSGAGLNLDDEDFTISRLSTTLPSQLFLEPPGLCQGYEYQVATLTGLTVTRGITTAFGPATIRSQTQAGLSPASANTIVLTQLGTNPAMPNSAPMCYYFGRGTVSSPTTLAFTRGGGAPSGTCDNYSSGPIHWQRVDFGSRGRVQQISVTMLAGDTAVAQPILPVDPNRTLTFLGTQAMQGTALGETADTSPGSDALGPSSATTELNGTASAVTVTRAAGDQPAIFTLYVVEIVP